MAGSTPKNKQVAIRKRIKHEKAMATAAVIKETAVKAQPIPVVKTGQYVKRSDRKPEDNPPYLGKSPHKISNGNHCIKLSGDAIPEKHKGSRKCLSKLTKRIMLSSGDTNKRILRAQKPVHKEHMPYRKKSIKVTTSTTLRRKYYTGKKGVQCVEYVEGLVYTYRNPDAVVIHRVFDPMPVDPAKLEAKQSKKEKRLARMAKRQARKILHSRSA